MLFCKAFLEKGQGITFVHLMRLFGILYIKFSAKKKKKYECNFYNES